ncbi:MAG TPA: dicarboxylate/amino acid:cation symporter [Chitinophagaceae bacterium]|nr:dicarboxylate/amino acid:cation symporter [Chitinophagaceae bacterium]MCB9056279.1 dicarboxylate/amino acid:cation symporter [Chitinophagales bacterium]HPG10621.1 dicarboxylate/amino acid:cation symporter [Chitinophagaceae bacterium]HRX93794.1 dicarboxylate/amino acid:cation symporter [Chitinophagaceae bacterium]
MKKIPLYLKIILGMLLGVIFGVVVIQFSGGVQFTKDWIKPFGNIFINLLKLIAIPLILASLVKGVSDLKDISKLSRMGLRTVIFYLFTTVFAVSLGLGIVNLVKPGKAISEETRTQMLQTYGVQATEKQTEAHSQKEGGPLKFVEDIVPDNIFKATSTNSTMLQVIFFALFMGIALIMIPPGRAKPVVDFFDSFNDVVLKMIDIIMKGAPYGVFALMAALVAESPGFEIFMALGKYAITVLVGLIILIFLFYPTIIYLFTRRNPIQFLKQISPAQLLAFSTSSSAATLPVTMDVTENRVGVDNEVTSFVLPIGATVNMDGTSLYQAVAAVFIAQAFGMDLSLGAQLGIIATATLASIGSAAVPSAGMVMLVIVLGQAGIPEAGLALIFAIDRPLDMVRTVANVTSDCTVSTVIAKSIGKLDDPKHSL